MKRFKNKYCYYLNLAISFFAVIILSASGRLRAEPPVRPPVFGEAIKIGEVTTDSAMLWARLCETDQCDSEFRLAGCPGEVRVRYRVAGSKDEMETPWKSVDPEADYTAKIELEELSPGTEYQFEIEARNDAGAESQTGKFRTAPAADDPARVRFMVTTGHKYATIDDPEDGQRIYPAMLALDPDFFVHTGDVVYYDNDTPPLAKNIDLARRHWHRLYSLPNHREFHRQVPTYFMKDDHDVLSNDCYPGQTYGDLKFAEGQRIFVEQNPIRSPNYRTVRWGKHLQVWIVEGRDFRSANTDPDGPEKTIWGTEQIAWFKRTVQESDATFKILITPTPIIGPDRPSKNDNHANASFQHEGDMLRKWLAGQPNLYVICGDRHWQYISEDQTTGLREYSSGPSTNAHAGGWRKSDLQPEHKFLRVAGGFLSVEVREKDGQPQIVYRHHDVRGRVKNEDIRDKAD